MKKGFSLIELMTVLVIVSILCFIAYPSYRNFIVRAHRTEGRIALLDLANRMEWYFANHKNYKTATIAQNEATDVLRLNHSSNHWYQLSIANASDSGYTLLATPLGRQAIDDLQCQTFTYDIQGRRGIADGPMGKPLGTADECW